MFNNSNCKYVLSETNSLTGLTAGKERQLWQLDGMSKSTNVSVFWARCHLLCSCGQRESPSSDCSLKSCDGKSVAHSSAPRHGWHGCCQWASRIISTLLNGVQRQTLKATQRASKSSCFLACSSCFPVWPFAELLDEGCSFSDLVCMLCSALRGRSARKNPKHTVAWDMGRWKHIGPGLDRSIQDFLSRCKREW